MLNLCLKTFKIHLFCLVLLGFSLIYPTIAHAEYFVINDFDVNIDLETNGLMTVTEIIDVTFSEPRHGIFRNIPYKYKSDFDTKYSTAIKVLAVTNGANKPRPYTTSRSNGEVIIKIGDPDKYVSDTKTYKITYTVDRAILFNNDWDEIYWNVTGHEWGLSIGQANLTFNLPDTNHATSLRCFTGSQYSQDENCTITQTGATISSATTKPLAEHQGLTVNIQIPKGVITEPTTTEKIIAFFKDNYPFLIPLLVLWFMIYWYNKYGRDPDLNQPIIARYEPPHDLTPAEMGTLLDETANMKDISAEIIYLATQGYLTIKEKSTKGIFGTKTDYELILSKKNQDKLHSYQKFILDNIFSVNKTVLLSSLKNEFYTSISDTKTKLYQRMLDHKYFKASPNKIRSKYFIITFELIIASIALSIWLSLGLPWIFAIIVSGAIVSGFGYFMPAKTKQGVLAYNHVKGFELFINTTEKHLAVFKEKENIFDEVLPYALVFGLGSKWINAFKNIYGAQTTVPTWYIGSTPNFSLDNFDKSLTSFSKTTNTTLASKPGSGGSGGSGGGFGGGGGGSW